MKKQVITIEREVPDEWDDDVLRRVGPNDHIVVASGDRVSVVSEPIPEPRRVDRMRVDYTHGPHDTRAPEVIAKALAMAIKNAPHLDPGSFHVEVIPQ